MKISNINQLMDIINNNSWAHEIIFEDDCHQNSKDITLGTAKIISTFNDIVIIYSERYLIKTNIDIKTMYITIKVFQKNKRLDENYCNIFFNIPNSFINIDYKLHEIFLKRN